MWDQFGRSLKYKKKKKNVRGIFSKKHLSDSFLSKLKTQFSGRIYQSVNAQRQRGVTSPENLSILSSHGAGESIVVFNRKYD